MTSFSQTIKENINKLSKDQKTAENAAKADVYIVDSKKKISDTISSSSSTNRNTKAVRKKKYKQ
jgi:flagellar hook-basal body complex protein FliE